LSAKQHRIIGNLMAADLTDTRKAEILLEVLHPPLNQVAKVIERIKISPDDADKTIVLWDPETHGRQTSGRPCLIELNFLVRNGTIDAKAVFRSHDIPKGWIFNLYGIWKALEDVCTQTGYRTGTVIVESESAHMYLADIEMVKGVWEQEIVQSKPEKKFRQEEGDPRGDLNITIVDGLIYCQLVDPQTAKPITEITGQRARELVNFINHHHLISQPSHGLDLGMQLLAAEWALRLGIPYTQDQEYKVLAKIKERYGKFHNRKPRSR
jgi:hypothetical protein